MATHCNDAVSNRHHDVDDIDLKSLDSLLNQRPIDWAAVLSEFRRFFSSTVSHGNGQDDSDKRSDIASKALHLACTATNPQTRAPSSDIVSELRDVLGPEMFLRVARPCASVGDDFVSLSALHRACVPLLSSGSFDSRRRPDPSPADGSLSLAAVVRSSRDSSSSPTRTMCSIARFLIETRASTTITTTTTSVTSSDSDNLPSTSSESKDNDGSTNNKKNSIPICLHQDRYGQTPLHIAVSWGAKQKIIDNDDERERKELIQYLIDAVHDRGGLLLQDQWGNTPLHRAILQRTAKGLAPDTDVEMMLLEACPDAIEVQNLDGMTPPHCTVEGRLAIPVDDEEEDDNDVQMMDVNNHQQQQEMPAGVAEPPEPNNEHEERAATDERAWAILSRMGQLRPNAFLIQDRRRGFTPLHYACENDVSPPLVNLLLEAERNEHSKPSQTSPSSATATSSLTSISSTVHEQQRVAATSATLIQDPRGFTPLHLACLDRAGNDVARALLLAGPKAASMRDAAGYTPLHRAWHSHVTCVEAFGRALERAEVPSSLLVGLSGQLFDKLSMLVKAAYCGTLEDDEKKKWRMVHAAAGIDCPLPVLRMTLLICPGQISEADEDGNLPLHIACSSPDGGTSRPPPRLGASLLEEDEEEDDDSSDEEEQEDVHPHTRLAKRDSQSWSTIETLVRERKQNVLVPDGRGRLPLHLAIESGKTWETGVGSIFHAAPEVLAMIDPWTKLYPFMLAGTVGMTTEQIAIKVDEEMADERGAEEAKLVAEDAQRAVEDAEDGVEEAGIFNDVVELRKWAFKLENARESARRAFENVESWRKIVKKEREIIRQEELLLDNVYRLLRSLPELVKCGIIDSQM